MATYVLIHGAGSTTWYWHLVGPELERRGHDVVAVDLPCDDDSAGFPEYADVVVDAIGDRSDVILVAQSLAGFTAPLVCDRVAVDLIVLVAAMVPAPGESAGEWWANTGQEQAQREQAEREGRDPDDDDPVTVFLHDLPPELIADSLQGVREPVGHAVRRALAPRGMAGRPDAVPAVSRRPLLPCGVPTPRRS